MMQKKFFFIIPGKYLSFSLKLLCEITVFEEKLKKNKNEEKEKLDYLII